MPFRLIYIGLFSGLGIFSYLLLLNYSGLPEKATEAFYPVWMCLFLVLVFNVLGYFTIRISSWLNNQYAMNIRRRWKIVTVYGLVMCMFLLLNYGWLVIAKLLIRAAHPFTFPNGGIRLLVIVWLIELVVLGLLLANRSMHRALRLQQQTADLQKENNTARYTALQNQLNPHFLFNNLNTLIAEIEYNPGNAIRFTKNLSDVYRYVLQCQDKPLVSLNEELGFMQAYLFLHQVRLGDCISCTIEIPADQLEQMLPPLTLQLLAENVIKHNSITSIKPMNIQVAVADGFLVVSNLIHPKKTTEQAGIGLQNLAKRCKLITGKDIQVSDRFGVFIVKIPLTDE